jgi:hypothetical protein
MVGKGLLKLLDARLSAQKLDANLLDHVWVQWVDDERLPVKGSGCLHIALCIEGIGFHDIGPSISWIARNGAVCCQLCILIVCEIAIRERNDTPDCRIVESQLNSSLRKVTSSFRLIFT